MERQVVIDTEAGQLLGTLFLPEKGVKQLCLLCLPLFEERKNAYLPLVTLARALVTRDTAVLRFDYRGCGDSSGDFADAALLEWIADATKARDWLVERFPGRHLTVFGLRFGAVPACRLAETGNTLCLWEPVLTGEAYILGELRKKLMKEMMTFGANRTTREALITSLEKGEMIDLDGYALTPPQYRDFKELDLVKQPFDWGEGNTCLFTIGPGSRLPPAMAAFAEKLKDRGPLEIESLRMQAFWNQIGMVDCSDLIEKTVALLTEKMEGATHAPFDQWLPETVQNSHWVPERAEMPVDIEVDSERVAAMLHRPEPANNTGVGVVFCHGWSGGRLGPHRMFVKLARLLAEEGVTSLRMDFRGRGESGNHYPEYGIRTMAVDAQAGLDWLASRETMKNVFLLGICSGAKVAVSTAVENEKAAGLVLWSAEGLGPIREAATNRKKTGAALKTYAKKLLKPATWKKIIAGKVDTRAVRKAVLDHETRSEEEAVRETATLQKFRHFRKPVLFIYGGNDPDTQLAGENYEVFCRENGLRSQSFVIPEANHSFYSLEWEKDVITRTIDWMNKQVNENRIP